MDALHLPGFRPARETGHDAAKRAPNGAAEGLPTAETVPILTDLDSQRGIETRSPEAALERAFPRWPSERRKALVSQVLRRHTRVLTVEDSDFPIDDDIPGCPAVLFVEGRRLEVLTAPRVAVVGTRAASVHGLTDAWELGAFLGAAGVSVVSGLAIGIDGAAHHGAVQAAEAARNRRYAPSSPATADAPGVPLSQGLCVADQRSSGVVPIGSGSCGAPPGHTSLPDGSEGEIAGGDMAGPIGVVATGLDVVYPRRHRALFERVRQHGVLLGEQPFGVPPERGRFPVRNRIIAALADVVVVVEATLTGGSRITAERA